MVQARHSTSTSMIFFFNNTAATAIYTLSLHELFRSRRAGHGCRQGTAQPRRRQAGACLDDAAVVLRPDRKSTRLNSSHGYISYAVFCLKKKNINFSEGLVQSGHST